MKYLGYEMNIKTLAWVLYLQAYIKVSVWLKAWWLGVPYKELKSHLLDHILFRNHTEGR